MKPLPYRDCVVGVFIRDGQILACERRNQLGQWQLPQGGVEEGESHEQAIMREMYEELGTNLFIIKRELKETISYLFPNDLNAPIAKKYCGQKQRWFLMEFEKGVEPDLHRAIDKEFISFSWRSAREIIDQIIDWKRDSYVQGFRGLGLYKK